MLEQLEPAGHRSLRLHTLSGHLEPKKDARIGSGPRGRDRGTDASLAVLAFDLTVERKAVRFMLGPVALETVRERCRRLGAPDGVHPVLSVQTLAHYDALHAPGGGIGS